MDVAIEMVTSHVGVRPVVGRLRISRFINGGDVIRAIDKGMDLKQTGRRHHEFGICGESKRIRRWVVSRVFEMGFQILPVVQDRKVVRSITRHDLLRAQLGLGPSVDEREARGTEHCKRFIRSAILAERLVSSIVVRDRRINL